MFAFIFSVYCHLFRFFSIKQLWHITLHLCCLIYCLYVVWFDRFDANKEVRCYSDNVFWGWWICPKWHLILFFVIPSHQQAHNEGDISCFVPLFSIVVALGWFQNSDSYIFPPLLQVLNTIPSPSRVKAWPHTMDFLGNSHAMEIGMLYPISTG